MRQIPEDTITAEGARRRHIVGPALVAGPLPSPFSVPLSPPLPETGEGDITQPHEER